MLSCLVYLKKLPAAYQTRQRANITRFKNGNRQLSFAFAEYNNYRKMAPSAYRLVPFLSAFVRPQHDETLFSPVVIVR